MNRQFQVFKSELLHFSRSPLKIVALFLYVFAAIYGLQNGYGLFVKHNKEITAIKSTVDESISEMMNQYASIEKGEIEKPRRDPTTPYWAIWNTPSYAFKYPSPMMVFSLGQSEQYGYYKRVTNWSSVYDSDLAEEIANPERLAIGTLDFSFVFIYLTPILIIIFLFNIAGLEKDLGFDRLIYLQNISKLKWLILRFLFYFFIILLTLSIITFVYAFAMGTFKNHTNDFFNFVILIFSYALMWFVICCLINYFGSGSTDQAIKMISIWLVLCIIIPGLFHQIISIKFPAGYMTDFIDASREQSDDIFDLPTDSLQIKLLQAFPKLEKTLYATDTLVNKSIINRSLSGLINNLNKNVVGEIEMNNGQKNKLIKKFNLINPVVFFQNQINALTGTDYFAYLSYRNSIQAIIDKKIDLIITETWNKVEVDKEIYSNYVNSFN